MILFSLFLSPFLRIVHKQKDEIAYFFYIRYPWKQMLDSGVNIDSMLIMLLVERSMKISLVYTCLNSFSIHSSSHTNRMKKTAFVVYKECMKNTIHKLN